MATSGPWIENNDKGGITVGVTDYGVEMFGGDDWEWTASFDKENSEILIKNLREGFDEEMNLVDILIQMFGEILSTTAFVDYCNSLNLKYELRRACV